jgi:hypothetical protein
MGAWLAGELAVSPQPGLATRTRLPVLTSPMAWMQLLTRSGLRNESSAL